MLFFSRRFLPLFVCQFCGALNDTVFRLAFVAMLVYGQLPAGNTAAVVHMATALFMLPFFLFSAVGGELADFLGKRKMLRYNKAAECGVMALAALAVWTQNTPLCLFALFLAGTQSAFFGSVKYALLPAMVGKGELLLANALFGASTFAAIALGALVGAMAGALAGGSEAFRLALCVGFVGLAVAGFAAAVLVPPPQDAQADSANPAAARFAPWLACKQALALLHRHRPILGRALAASWFWLVGALTLNALPLLGRGNYEAALFAVFAGVCAGAIFCRLYYGKNITAKHAPALLVLIAALLWALGACFAPRAGAPLPLVLALLFCLAAALAAYVIPLRAGMQAQMPAAARGRLVAAYNIYNALFIVAGAGLAAALAALAGHDESDAALQTAGAASLLLALPLCLFLPPERLRAAARQLCRLLFRVRVEGEENLTKSDGVIVCNHPSYLDGFLIWAFLQTRERQLVFAVDSAHAKRPAVAAALCCARFAALCPQRPHGLRRIIRQAQGEGLRPVFFPEGQVNGGGALLPPRAGAALVAEKTGDGMATPVFIRGAEFSYFSKAGGKLRRRLLPQIVIAVCPPRRLAAPAAAAGKAGRAQAERRLTEMLEDAALRSCKDKNLTLAFGEGARLHGASGALYAELPARRLNRRAVFRAAVALGGMLRGQHQAGERVGVMLPTSVAAGVVFWAAVFLRLVPALFNPAAGAGAARAALAAAQVKTVYTSQKLLDALPQAASVAAALQEAGAKIVLLETLRDSMPLKTKLRAALAALAPARAAAQLAGAAAAANDEACVLFTSGTEGRPKGVSLSHANLCGNARQILARVEATEADVLTNTLPVFHSFGLMAGVILPVFAGATAWQYPTPLHYKQIPAILRNNRSTIFFSADTFLRQYGLAAQAADFAALRLVVAGAEKLKPGTRELWREKFNIRIMEGYGVTETAPAVCISTPASNRAGFVGRLLPGMEARLAPVEGIAAGGRLELRGINVMRGYYLVDDAGAGGGELRPPAGGWHNTGDIAEFDDCGRLKIVGRVKRFIKIAGEMAPLDGMEQAFKGKWEDFDFAVVGVADERRGEAAAVMTTAKTTLQELAAALQEANMPELWAPRRLLCVDALPLLATGKTDYAAVAAAFVEKK